jgi:hypothetical protein
MLVKNLSREDARVRILYQLHENDPEELKIKLRAEKNAQSQEYLP